MSAESLPVLEYLQKSLKGELRDGETSFMLYPTAISNTLKMKIANVGVGTATIEIETDPRVHGNQQGTVHGGLISELADAAIGTAHSTLIQEGQSFTSIELKVNFFRPVWNDILTAVARPIQSGQTITHYQCDIIRQDGKLAAVASSIVMTLKGSSATGR